MKTVILVNVGTPDSFEPEDVGNYLQEFLMDKNIITIPRPFRDILVKLIIVPKRKFRSSEKYKKIWTPEGSPLMVHSRNLKTKLEAFLGDGWQVLLGMQVGNPALKDVIRKSSEIYFCPLYPQYATATTGGALEVLADSAQWILKPFYKEPWFIKALADRIRASLKPQDHLLLSYHGLPVQQIKAHHPSCYLTDNCCEQAHACEKNCYRAQCLQTTRLLQAELGISQVSTSFQSRLGRAQWIEPSTESVTRQLAHDGVKHLKVACPAFVADCLETLEEIGIELKQQFLSDGGESFELIPAINDHEIFVRGLGNLLLANSRFYPCRGVVVK